MTNAKHIKQQMVFDILVQELQQKELVQKERANKEFERMLGYAVAFIGVFLALPFIFIILG